MDLNGGIKQKQQRQNKEQFKITQLFTEKFSNYTYIYYEKRAVKSQRILTAGSQTIWASLNELTSLFGYLKMFHSSAGKLVNLFR